jgi:hypothetical protein
MWEDMVTFVYSPMANMRYMLEALDRSKSNSVNNKMWDEISERQEYAFNKSQERIREGMQ